MVIDANGLAVAGSGHSVAQLDEAVDALIHFREGCVSATQAAIQEDPTSPMANVMNAYLGLLTTEAVDRDQAAEAFGGYLRTANLEKLLPRERMHVDAVLTWISGNMLGAGQILLELSHEYPRDALALMVGHQIDFFTGDALLLRDRVGSVLSSWSEADRHYGPVLGMYAFGLEEVGHYDRSEETGRRAVELDPLDVWGIHSVAHTYEMQGRFGDGTRYFDERRPAWTSRDNFFRAHNWWHYCLYALEAGDVDTAVELYDAKLHNERVPHVAMQMLDAAALLWRLYLEGHDQTTRWRALADAWLPKVEVPLYAFNDMHAVMAFIGCGDLTHAERLIADRELWLSDPHPGVTNHVMTANVGLPVCKALVAFGKASYDQVIDLLYPIRYRINELGGSHAQRDAVYKTLLEAALRGGRTSLARSLISERIYLRPSSPYNWLKRSQLLQGEGDELGADVAAQRAKALVGGAKRGGQPTPTGVGASSP